MNLCIYVIYDNLENLNSLDFMLINKLIVFNISFFLILKVLITKFRIRLDEYNKTKKGYLWLNH